MLKAMIPRNIDMVAKRAFSEIVLQFELVEDIISLIRNDAQEIIFGLS